VLTINQSRYLFPETRRLCRSLLKRETRGRIGDRETEHKGENVNGQPGMSHSSKACPIESMYAKTHICDEILPGL
jgi:hypothetical protein